MRTILMADGLAIVAELCARMCLYERLCVCVCVCVCAGIAGDATLLCRGVNANYQSRLTCVIAFEEVISCRKQQQHKSNIKANKFTHC